MIRRDSTFGQLDVASSTATIPDGGGIGLMPFYLIAVASGITVFLITRWLEAGARRRR